MLSGTKQGVCVDKEIILQEIRRLAAESGGTAPGQDQFETLTGISPGKWRGRLWLRWSDAVTEAGFTPSRMQEAHADEFLLGCLARLTRTCGHFPTSAEVKMERVRDATFPNHGVFDRLGNKATRIAKLKAFCRERTDWADIVELLPSDDTEGSAASPSSVGEASTSDGYVYMLKLGKHFKIGKTFAVPRRHRQIALELPEKPDVVHFILTDDPDGIEDYWHRRFASKQTNGEWFALDVQDVRAFRRRKFM